MLFLISYFKDLANDTEGTTNKDDCECIHDTRVKTFASLLFFLLLLTLLPLMFQPIILFDILSSNESNHVQEPNQLPPPFPKEFNITHTFRFSPFVKSERDVE